MSELKPCLCGNDVKLHRQHGIAYIACDLCGLIASYRGHESERETRMMRNTRATDRDAVIEKLRDLLGNEKNDEAWEYVDALWKASRELKNG